MFRLSQETIAIVTVGPALAGLGVTSDGSIRSEMQAMRAEAEADREALGRLTGIVEEVRTARR